MEGEHTTYHIALLTQRLMQLRRQVQQGSDPRDVLGQALDALEAAVDRLHEVSQALVHQAVARQDSEARGQTELHTYQALFEAAPLSYLVTSVNGTIVKANQMAGQLVQMDMRRLVGRSLSQLLPAGERRSFQTYLHACCQWPGTYQRALTIQPAQAPPRMCKF